MAMGNQPAAYSPSNSCGGMKIAIVGSFFIMTRVRCVTLFFGLLAMALIGGCAVAEQDASEVGDQLQRGLQGQGRIVPNDPTTDSFGPEYN
jgi:hypothetical protein